MQYEDRATDASVGAVERRARRLVERWAAVTRNMSSLSQMCRVPEFSELVAMGRDAVPALLGLYRDPDNGHLFLVLQAITGQNPAPPETNGKPKEIRRAWLQWGRLGDAPDSG